MLKFLQEILKHFHYLCSFCDDSGNSFNIFNLTTLSFKSKELENKYGKFEKKRMLLMFKITTIIQIMLNLSDFISAIINNEKTIGWMRLGFVIWQIFILSCYKLAENKINDRILFSGISYINSTINSFLVLYGMPSIGIQTCGKKAIIQYISIAITIRHNNICYLFGCPSWIVQCLICITTIILYGLYTSALIFEDWNMYVLLLLILFLLRVNEYYKRYNFYLIKKMYSNLQECKDIFDKTVPSSIIVLAKQTFINKPLNENQLDLLYSNDFSKKFFGTQIECEIISKLQNIFVSSKTVNSEYQQQDHSLNLDQIIKKELLTEPIEGLNHCFDYSLLKDSIKLACYQQTKQVNESTEVEFKKCFLDVNIAPCKWENRYSLMINISDITEKIEGQRFKDLDRYKDKLLATVSHDLKTPLNGMVLMVQIMKNIISGKSSLQQQQIQGLENYLIFYFFIHILDIEQLLDNSYQSQMLLLSMINDLLDHSQIVKGTLRLSKQSFNICDTFNFVNSILCKQAQEKSIELQWNLNIQPVHHRWLYSDETRLKQILINLVGNSIKFTREGFIKVTATNIKINGESIIEISVVDTGIGIPIDIQSKLFQLYATFDYDSTNKHGVGLGLTITKQLVQMLGPQNFLQLESAQGKGSKFSFQIYQIHNDIYYEQINEDNQDRKNIPIFNSNTSINKHPLIGSPSNIQENSISFHQIVQFQQSVIKQKDYFNEIPNVLIVDDTPFNIIALEALIKKILKCNFYKAFNGYEAIKICNNTQINLVFMDINMPEMDGHDCTQKLRELEKKGEIERLDIVVATAFTNQKDREDSMRFGADYHLEKPVDIKILKNVLKSLNYLKN